MTSRLTVDVHLAPSHRIDALAHDVREGLFKTPKTLPPTWFYDDRGSLLFDEITRLEEYYQTRTERSILEQAAQKIAQLSDARVLVELGSGTSEKTRILLEALRDHGSLELFIPFDVSEEILRSSAEEIEKEYEINVHAVVGDFHRHLGTIPRDRQRLIAFLGSTIGNLSPNERHGFLSALAATMGTDERLLLGVDLVKDVKRLIAAYDDAQGTTAAFNKNVLEVLNRELGANFDPDAFAHVALWNADEQRIEMWLRSIADQRIEIKGIDRSVDFAEGEALRSEISTKFTPEQITAELTAAHLGVVESWSDDEGDFLVVLAQPRR